MAVSNFSIDTKYKLNSSDHGSQQLLQICTLYLYQDVSVLQKTYKEKYSPQMLYTHVSRGMAVMFLLHFLKCGSQNIPDTNGNALQHNYNVQPATCYFFGINSKSTSNICVQFVIRIVWSLLAQQTEYISSS
jgi:hypothetical protein